MHDEIEPMPPWLFVGARVRCTTKRWAGMMIGAPRFSDVCTVISVITPEGAARNGMSSCWSVMLREFMGIWDLHGFEPVPQDEPNPQDVRASVHAVFGHWLENPRMPPTRESAREVQAIPRPKRR